MAEATPSFRTAKDAPPGWKAAEAKEKAKALYDNLGLGKLRTQALAQALATQKKDCAEKLAQIKLEEMEAFFEAQETLQEEARGAFTKYDVDDTGSMDTAELYNMLEDMSSFKGMPEAERSEYCKKVLDEHDVNHDGKIDFDEFVVMYNRLVDEKESNQALAYKVPSIFGGELEEAEEHRVKQMKPLLDKSVMAERCREAQAKDYFDTAALRDKMFKNDFARIEKKKSWQEFKKKHNLATVVKETGKLKNLPAAALFKKLLREDYDMLCNCYTYFSSKNAGGNFATMDFDEFKEFASAAGYREKDDAPGKSGKAKNIVDLKGLFKEINVVEAGKSKAQQAENDANEDEAFMRFEFLECVMRLALQFPNPKQEDLKVTIMGYIEFTRQTLQREAPVAVLDRNVFRKDRLYTRDALDVLARYATELKQIFTLTVGRTGKGLGVNQAQFTWLAERLALVDRHLKPEEGGLHEGELRIIHVWSQMMVADELKNMGEFVTLSFTEFLEALARIADIKDLYTKAELEEHKLPSALAAAEATEFSFFSKRKRDPPIPREVVSSLWDDKPKEQSMGERLEMLLDYMFGMLAPTCGSLLLGTYEAAALFAALEDECIAYHGELLWPKWAPPASGAPPADPAADA